MHRRIYLYIIVYYTLILNFEYKKKREFNYRNLISKLNFIACSGYFMYIHCFMVGLVKKLQPRNSAGLVHDTMMLPKFS